MVEIPGHDDRAIPVVVGGGADGKIVLRKLKGRDFGSVQLRRCHTRNRQEKAGETE